MLKVNLVRFEDLTKDMQEQQPDNGSGAEYASYIELVYNNNVIAVYSDAVEPEDASFTRDFSWIQLALSTAYGLGLNDAK